jgi:hypothetical protein
VHVGLGEYFTITGEPTQEEGAYGCPSDLRRPVDADRLVALVAVEQQAGLRCGTIDRRGHFDDAEIESAVGIPPRVANAAQKVHRGAQAMIERGDAAGEADGQAGSEPHQPARDVRNAARYHLVKAPVTVIPPDFMHTADMDVAAQQDEALGRVLPLLGVDQLEEAIPVPQVRPGGPAVGEILA